MKINKLDVFIRFSEEEKLVGQLVLDGRDILFKYSEQYLETSQNLSPFKLNFDAAIQTGPANLFDGLFGVFSDSLPDAWGNLLLKKHLSKNKIAIETLTVLDRLSFVGENGLGALVYKPSINDGESESKAVNLSLIHI